MYVFYDGNNLLLLLFLKSERGKKCLIIIFQIGFIFHFHINKKNEFALGRVKTGNPSRCKTLIQMNAFYDGNNLLLFL